jgi:hypothetical protein
VSRVGNKNETDGVLGSSELNSELLDASALCGHLVAPGSVEGFPAEHRRRLFHEAMFVDLFPSARGRPSIPGEVIATVILLHRCAACGTGKQCGSCAPSSPGRSPRVCPSPSKHRDLGASAVAWNASGSQIAAGNGYSTLWVFDAAAAASPEPSDEPVATGTSGTSSVAWNPTHPDRHRQRRGHTAAVRFRGRSRRPALPQSAHDP